MIAQKWLSYCTGFFLLFLNGGFKRSEANPAFSSGPGGIKIAGGCTVQGEGQINMQASKVLLPWCF